MVEIVREKGLDGWLGNRPEPSKGSAWYVVATAPGQDYRVRDEIGRLGFCGWLPECKVIRCLRRTLVTAKGPLFPGYQFVRLDLSLAHWQAIERIRGVDGLLGHDERPWPLPSGEVGRLRQLVADDGGCIVIQGGAVRRQFAEGAAVAIEGGLWEGWKGIYVEQVRGRCKILLDLFGRPTETLVPEALVIPA